MSQTASRLKQQLVEKLLGEAISMIASCVTWDGKNWQIPNKDRQIFNQQAGENIITSFNCSNSIDSIRQVSLIIDIKNKRLKTINASFKNYLFVINLELSPQQAHLFDLKQGGPSEGILFTTGLNGIDEILDRIAKYQQQNTKNNIPEDEKEELPNEKEEENKKKKKKKRNKKKTDKNNNQIAEQDKQKKGISTQETITNMAIKNATNKTKEIITKTINKCNDPRFIRKYYQGQLNTQKKQYQSEIQAMQNENNKLTRRYGNLQMQYNLLNGKKDKISDKLNNIQNDKNIKKRDIEQKEQELERARKEKEKLERDILDLRDKIDKLTSEKNQNKNKGIDFQNQINKLKSNLEEKQKQLNLVKSNNTQLIEQKNALQAQCNALEDDNAALDHKLHNTKQEVKQLKKDIKEKDKRINVVNRNANKLVNQYMNLQQGNVILQNQNANLINELNKKNQYDGNQSIQSQNGSYEEENNNNNINVDNENNSIRDNNIFNHMLPYDITKKLYQGKRMNRNMSDTFLNSLKNTEKALNQYPDNAGY